MADSILNTGVEPNMPESLVRHIRAANFALLLLVGGALALTPVFYILGKYTQTFGALIAALLYFLALEINRRYKYNAARLLLVLFINGFAVLCLLTSAPAAFPLFFMNSLLGVLFFKLKEWKFSMFSLVLSLSLFAYFEFFYPMERDGAASRLAYALSSYSFLVGMGTLFFYLRETEARQRELIRRGDVLERKNQELSFLARTDSLTLLANRGALQDRLEELIQESLASGEALSLIILDIDKFKDYNDSFGHLEGDEVLKQIADILLNGSRRRDKVARYGGEEFVLLLPGTGEAGVLKIAERLRGAIEKYPWAKRNITASFGTATMNPEQGREQADQLLRIADEALYKAKRAGRNKVVGAGDKVTDSWTVLKSIFRMGEK